MTSFNKDLLSKTSVLEFVKFGIVGAIGTIVNLGILYLFTDIFSIYYIISEIIAFIASSLNNFVLDKIWTFGENFQDQVVKKYSKFIIICLMSLILNIIILFILVEYFEIWYILAEFFSILCAFLVNYTANKIWNFNKKI